MTLTRRSKSSFSRSHRDSLSQWESKSPNTVVLDMKGRLSVLDLPLRDQVNALLQQGCAFFVLNIAEVDYIDSSGLGQLISVWASVRKLGGNVVLLRPIPRVRRLLVTTCLQTIFDVFEDEEKAKAGVRRDWSPS